MGGAVGRGPSSGCRPSSPRRRSGRPGRRLRAEHPRDARRVPRRGLARRRLVERRSRVRGPLRDRPSEPDRTGRPGCDRRLSVRHEADRAVGSRRRDRRRASVVAPRRPRPVSRRRRAARHRRTRRHPVGRAHGARRRGTGIHRAAGRPPALRAVQLGHHRTPEGDRARPRRRRRRASQGAHVPPGPRRWRPLLLVLHDGLDDVELLRVRPPRGIGRGAVRR